MGNASLPEFLPKLREWRSSPDPALADAARWAIARLENVEAGTQQ
jgi:hypothetical protein